MKRTHGVWLLTLAATFMAWPAIGFAEDPDYGNDSTTAEPITTDKTWLYGEITTDDEDWFVFTPGANEMLRVWFAHTVSNWMRIYAYQADDLGTLVQFADWSIYNDPGTYRTFFLEYARPVYLRVVTGSGAFGVAAEFLQTVPPDSYSNACAAPSAIAVGAQVHGTLEHSDPLEYDQDWFTFDTEPLHMYSVQLTQADNSYVRTRLHADDCTELWGNTGYVTFVSWYGDPFKLNVNGQDTRLGNWYELLVTDLGEFPDDYGNTADAAAAIPTNGDPVSGSIEYSASLYSDEDWFTFTPVANSRYEISLNSQADNWRNVQVYQENEFGDPIRIMDWGAYGAANPPVVRSAFFEYDRPVYLRVYSATGGYHLAVEWLETALPDSYSDTCAEASPILPDGQPVYATLDHQAPQTIDQDWFAFNTEPLRKYRVQLGHLDNSYARFRLVSGDCATQIWGNTTDITFVSWYGDDYRIHVQGNVNYVGTYYWLIVTDLGEFPDDHGNTYDLATTMPKNGTETPGSIQYLGSVGSDEDWFTFLGGADGQYSVTLNNPNTHWSALHLYRENDLEQPVQVANFSVYNNSATNLYSLAAGRYWIRVSSGTLGDYLVSVVSPEPRCGDLDHPYPPGDANQDCYLDLRDIAVISQGWLTCTDPLPPCLYLP